MRPHRLEKPPKFALYFSYSVIIGIPIQTGVCCRSSFCQFRGAVGGSQEKLSPAKSTWSWKLCLKTMCVSARVIIPCKNGGRIFNSGVTSLFARELFLTRFCNKYLNSVTCLPEANHCMVFMVFAVFVTDFQEFLA